MLNRRDFIKSTVAAGALWISRPTQVHGQWFNKSIEYFGVHPFVENHPEAVFIMRTTVDVKTNSQAIKDAGLTFGRSVFVPKEKGEGAVPITHKIAVKPNITCSTGRTVVIGDLERAKTYPLEYGMGIVTDPYFVEGTIDALKELWISGSQFYIREVSCPADFGPRGYLGVAERTGADIRDLTAEIGEISKNDINWVDVPDGWLNKKTPYLWPINTRDSWLLNIAKFKAHGMGLSLCCKNHQGSVAHHYQQFCGGVPALKKINKKHVVKNYEEICRKNYQRHRDQGIPRWDRPHKLLSGFMMDIWATRTLDNLSVSPMGLCVIEGVYGRDGNGFLGGPNKGKYSDNEAWDYMTNVVIFGKNPLLVDIIGLWLGGHEPGNLGLFHLAIERGMLNVLNPMDIPVYNWGEDGTATLTPLTEFTRSPLKTYYLRRNYNGQNEPEYHLLDEPFDYGSVKTKRTDVPRHPDVRVLTQHRANARNPHIPVEYSVPRNEYARLELLNGKGRLLDVLVDSYHRHGFHMAVLDTNAYAAGNYLLRFRFGDFTETQKIELL